MYRWVHSYNHRVQQAHTRQDSVLDRYHLTVPVCRWQFAYRRYVHAIVPLFTPFYIRRKCNIYHTRFSSFFRVVSLSSRKKKATSIWEEVKDLPLLIFQTIRLLELAQCIICLLPKLQRASRSTSLDKKSPHFILHITINEHCNNVNIFDNINGNTIT